MLIFRTEAVTGGGRRVGLTSFPALRTGRIPRGRAQPRHARSPVLRGFSAEQKNNCGVGTGFVAVRRSGWRYADADDKFDNRYVATVPSATALQQRGVKNIMYVVPSREQKERRSHDDFVAQGRQAQGGLFLERFQKVAQQVSRRSPMAPPPCHGNGAITRRWDGVILVF